MPHHIFCIALVLVIHLATHPYGLCSHPFLHLMPPPYYPLPSLYHLCPANLLH